MKRMPLLTLLALVLAFAGCKTPEEERVEAVAGDNVSVTVAKESIEAGTKLTREKVLFQSSPQKFVPPLYLEEADFDEYAGRTLRVTVPEGGIIVPRDFEPEPEAGPTGETKESPREAIVLKAADAPHRTGAGGKAEAVLLAEGENAYVGLLSMEGGAAVPEHRDPTEEYIYILEGSGTMYIDDKKYGVEPETIIYMPANAKVKFESLEPVRALQVFAGPEPAKKYDEWKPVD